MKVVGVSSYPGMEASVFFGPDDPDGMFRLYLGEGQQSSAGDMEPSPEGYFDGRLLAVLGMGRDAGYVIYSGADPELLDRLLPPTTDADTPERLRQTGQYAIELFRYEDGGPSVIAIKSAFAELVPTLERAPA